MELHSTHELQFRRQWLLGVRAGVCIPQLATYSWRLPTRATTAVVPTSAALTALPNSSSVGLKASVSALSNFSELKGTLSSALPASASSIAEVRKVSLSLPSLSSFPGCKVHKSASACRHLCTLKSFVEDDHATSPCFNLTERQMGRLKITGRTSHASSPDKTRPSKHLHNHGND